MEILNMETIIKNETLGQIAASDFRKALVLKKYNIDFCCGGKKTLKQVCREKDLDISKIEEELLQINENSSSAPLAFDEWSLDLLAEYIVNTHHSYVRNNLPIIRNIGEKVMKVHGKSHPELLNIYDLIEEISIELNAHMLKEERILFPYIKQLVEAMNYSDEYNSARFGGIQNPINIMEIEHELVGVKLARIRELTNNYSLPDGACTSYNLLYNMVDDFEQDLHVHVHLENNILFPKALELESQLAIK